ncbi:MAG: class I SAM-dependent methyltransferase [Thermoproteota archaeon]
MPQKNVCAKVPKIQGEKAITLLRGMNFIDRTLKIQRDEEFLYIPLLSTLDKDELKPLTERVPSLEVSTHIFPEKEKPPETLTEILENKIPPPLLESLPSAIDFVGDIAIVRIPSELEPYNRVIGEAILKLHKNVRTVLAKASAVQGQHRLRDFDLLAGEANTETIHREYGCRYYVDLAQAYFSPRLSYEHNRVSSLVQEGETVVDLFAGVGPFAILIAKTHQDVQVYAIDVNPQAVDYLKRNIVLNKVEEKVYPLLGDAEKIVNQELSGVADRVIMNLPEKALQFLGSACEAIRPEGGIVHLYSFVNTSHPIDQLKTKADQEIKNHGRSVEHFSSSRIVRGTAPYEWQAVIDIKIR